MPASKITERVAFPFRKMTHALDFQRLLVIIERPRVIAHLIINKPQVIQDRSFKFQVFDLMCNLQALIKMVDCFRIIRLVPENQSQVAQRFTLFQAIAQLLLDCEGAMKVIERMVVFAQILIGVADGVEGHRLAAAIVLSSIESEGALEFW